MDNMLQPPYLKKNDLVTIIAPAGKIASSLVANGARLLQQWGLRVKMGKYVGEEYLGFAGTDEQRCADLQAAVNDPESAAVLCARGGYGCGRIVDNVDFSAWLENPKWFIGYSDVTVFHARLQQLGLQSIHGTMPKNFPQNSSNESTESLRKALFGELLGYDIPAHPFNKPGLAKGVLRGGNLSLIINVSATPDDVDTTGAILFLEDVNEYLYSIDRMMNNLQRSGKLKRTAGVIVGDFKDSKSDEELPGKTAYEVIAGYLQPLDIPVCYGFPAGHDEPNYSLYFGRELSLEVTGAGVKINYL
ncbi:MAG: LD-carboxypeptidase [Prevotellaceae bacterium]|jgi:muramoyltetrapeptide carboxypeptidase|nr:LD-carboxypeptidase [Prevotellaceae bacterium]